MAPKKHQESFLNEGTRKITRPAGDILLTTTGDEVDGNVPLAPLASVGCYDLGGQNWPTWAERRPIFVEDTRRLFSSKEEFAASVFDGQWPTRATAGTTGRSTREKYGPHLRVLADAGVLDGPLDEGQVVTFATYFAVAKDVENFMPINARAIFDLREVNKIGEAPDTFSLFSVRDILRSIARIGPKVYFVHADLKNFYYQLGLPGWMHELMGIRLSNSREVYRSRVLPMGWDRSCRTAQALTVGGLGMRTVHENALGMPERLLDASDPPGLFELDFDAQNRATKKNLKGAGAVIYDTILIAVNEGQIAHQWADRIRLNFESRLGMSLKYLEIDRKTTFAGIDFEQDRFGPRWRVCDTTFATWQILAKNLRSTPRALWRALGFIRRFAEVHLMQRRTFGKLARIQAAIAQQNCAELRDRNAKWWDKEDPIIADALPQIKLRIQRLENQWQSLSAFREREKRSRESVANVLVDATLQLVSVVRLTENGTIAEWPDARPVPRCQVAGQTCQIDECESFAMNWGLQLPQVNEATIVVIGGDNTAASRAFWKGYSLAESIDGHIPETPNPRKTVIFVDIPTEDNIADVKTRPDLAWTVEEIEQRRRASFERLSAAYEAWTHWPGDTYFDRRDDVFRSVRHTPTTTRE